MDPTIKQIEQKASQLKTSLNSGQITLGNIELAAILGSRVAQRALNRQIARGMPLEEFIEFLLTDPNLQIKVNIKNR